ncbi:MAG TPA: hypothetical protein VHA33_12420 [Candidatus Angelobacter sp.]|nr:hypothetical protein [Candidatus Angelobacter sp.]
MPPLHRISQMQKSFLQWSVNAAKLPLNISAANVFYEGGRWTPALFGDWAVNRENFDLFVCSRCGHVEFFLEGVAEELRRTNAPESTDVLESNSTSDR